MVNLFIDILEMSIPVSVLILLLLAVSPLLKRAYVSKWRYYMWLFVAVRLLIPVRLGIKSAVTVPVPQSIAPLRDTVSADTLSPATILAAIWVLGIAALVIYRVICYISFNRLTKRWRTEITDADILREFRAAKDFAGVKRDIKIVRCKAVTTPMVFGLIRPVLLMPDVVFSQEELKIVLKHELVHVRRFDILYKLIITTAQTVYWFNPLMYVMTRAANRDLELACDAEVVKNEDGTYRRRYCEAIMRLVHSGRGAHTVLSTCFIFSKKTVLERFKYILDEKIKRSGTLMFAVVALSVVLSGGAVSFATEQVAESLEDNLQLFERVEEPPQATPTAVSTAAPQVTERPRREEKPSVTYVRDAQPNAQSVSVTPAPEPETEPDTKPQYNIQESGGEVSPDGSRVTYDLGDGTKAVVQYDGDTVDSGYILVN